jgi:bacterial/archaeal transporter family-2 protein
VPVLLALVFVGGFALSVQAFVNGRLGATLGSVELAASVNNAVGLVAAALIGVVTGALGRARRRLRTGRWPRWWHLLAGVNGALFVTIAAKAAPLVGVALFTVALVCGQSLGSLVIDRVGMSPAGRRPFTATRVLGVLLALVAVAIGALGSRGDLRLGLLALTAVAGVGVAVQQAALGHVANATGEPLAAVTVNLAVGGTLLIVVALATTGGSAPHGWSVPPLEWTGGLLGAGAGLTMAVVVRVIGVLRLVLAIVAGQAVGALVIDLVAAPPGEAVTTLTVVSVILTFAAVAVSGLPPRAGARRPAESA